MSLLAHVRFLDRIGHYKRLPRLNEIHLAELAYLSIWEDEMRVKERDSEFRNMIMAGDLWPDPELSLRNYREIFKDELRQPEDVEWVIPSSQDEIEEMMAAMAAGGSAEPIEEQRV